MTTMASRIGAAVGLVAVGVAGTLIWQRTWAPAPVTTVANAPAAAPAGGDAAASSTVQLSDALVARAGITVATAATGSVTASWHAPGTVEASSYRQTVVTPVAAGRVTAISAELGQRVAEGQRLAEIYSPELAEAERAYLAATADLELATQKRQRAEKLGAIGAVAQQEVDDTRAEFARQTSAVESARAKLRLLGLAPVAITALKSAADIDPVVKVPAPSSGTVIKRGVNRGQNVDEKTELVTIADLSTVWVIADVYERDMASVIVGADARVTSSGYPGRVWTGRVSYLDPQVAVETRTVKARVEVTNGDGVLRPGMLMDVSLSRAATAAAVTIPRTAVQQVGGRSVVFVPEAGRAGAYAVREVSLGAANGTDVEVHAGVAAGDAVVSAGAFALKAEWERLGGRLSSTSSPAPLPTGGAAPAPEAAHATGPAVPSLPAQRVTLKVTGKGFEPETIQVQAGRRVELVVTRTTDDTCGTQIVVGNGRQRADLPLNTPVTVPLGVLTKGELKITCGMAMLSGTVVVK